MELGYADLHIFDRLAPFVDDPAIDGDHLLGESDDGKKQERQNRQPFIHPEQSH